MSTAPDPTRRLIPALLVLGFAWLQAGCCQYYCAPPSVGCPPVAAQPSAVRYGAVCEAPTGTSGSSIADSPRPRVVVSEPSNGRMAGRSGWRRTDPDGLATTRVEGALDDDTVRR